MTSMRGGQTGPEGGAARGLITPAFVTLTTAEFAYFLAVGMMYSAVPLFAGGPLAADEIGVGVAVGAFWVTALLLRPFAGRISDRFGRRPLLLGGSLGFALVVLAHLVVDDLLALTVLRLLLGVAEAFFFVAGIAALADLAPPGREGEALSINSLSLYLGVAFGPLLGETLIDAGGFELAWLIAGGLAAVTAMLIVRLPETLPPSERPGAAATRPPLFHRGAVGPALALFSGVATMAGFLSVVALFGRELGMEGARFVLLLFGVLVVTLRLIFASLPDRVPALPLIALALAATALGLVVMGSLATPEALFAGAAMAAVGVAFLTPAVFALIFTRVAPAERGSAGGTASFFIDLGFGAGPVTIGVVAATAGYAGGLLAMAAVAAAGAMATIYAAYRDRGATPLTAAGH